MPSKEYTLLQGEGSIDEPCTHDDDEPLGFNKRHLLINWIVFTILALSLAANAFLVVWHFVHEPQKRFSDRTAFAGLERNKQIAWTHDNDFASHNRTVWGQAWETLNFNAGIVAISDKSARRTGLHQSQRWPWDPSKGLYLLEGYHSLHCLIILRASLTEMHDKVPQSLHFSHINHCLDSLRQEIICNADDTPRYSGLGQGGTGNNQYRMCRDWRKLEDWANAHSACYDHSRGVVTLDRKLPLDRFKNCPDASEPWKGLSNDG